MLHLPFRLKQQLPGPERVFEAFLEGTGRRVVLGVDLGCEVGKPVAALGRAKRN